MAKTNIRQEALDWFKTKQPTIDEAILTSKFYTSQDSWSKSRVWFFQIPLDVVNPKRFKYLYLICENHLKGEPFLYLKVPTFFILKNEKSFELDQKKKVLRLYFSAEAVDMFKEIRKSSNLDFSSFVQQE
ncbi:MAG: hypothetical protein E6H09_04100 [Bacteroidetes bacterium]|jgi:hypothetical protein|nr:MAG: hypothetical protein E6H09_04100 [Bacteroidota bacterium]